MDICASSKVPKDGWIHGCFNCGVKTANCLDYIHNDKTHTLYLCKQCVRDTKDENTRNNLIFYLQNRINTYISERTLEPYKYPVYSLDPPVMKKYIPSLPIPIPPKTLSPPLEDIIAPFTIIVEETPTASLIASNSEENNTNDKSFCDSVTSMFTNQ